MDYKEFFTTDNKSGWKCVERKLNNNFPDIYKAVADYCNKNKLTELKFVRQVWHFINDVPNIPICGECDNHAKFLRLESGYQEFCCVKCSNKNIKKINVTKGILFEKYGVDSSFKIPEVKKIIDEINIKNFGFDNPFNNKDVQNKIKENNLERYGFTTPTKSKEIQDKIKKTNLDRYGFESHLSSKVIRDKIKESTLNKYGFDNVFKDVNIQNKIKKNNLIKYGFENPAYSDIVKEKYRSTCLDKYGVESHLLSEDVKNKIKKINFEKYGNEIYFKSDVFNRLYKIHKKSKIELKVCEEINFKNNVQINGFYFDCVSANTLIEIDGDYYHKDKLHNLSLIQVNTVLNDKLKSDAIFNTEYTLYKVKVSEINKYKTITSDLLKDISYIPDYSLIYTQKIVTKEYFKKYIETKGINKLNNYVPLFLKFIRTFQSEFPYPDRYEELVTIGEYIRGFDFTRFHNKETNEFFNGTSVIGCNYLKSSFKSYWNSSYGKNKSPIEIWNDDEKMLKVIAYRIGINKSDEVFDFSMRNLIKGISAIRGTISFFKPVVAAGIYKHYLGDIENPVVFDPCCGFGGRMLGFKSLYPNGTYIGCEPNISTYNELIELSSNFDCVDIYNCKIEGFKEDISYDIAFTSIPYFDLEDYRNGIKYKDFNEWVNTFIVTLLSYPRLIVNMPYDLCVLLGLDGSIDGYLVNNRTHFSKNREYKKEVLLKLNF